VREGRKTKEILLRWKRERAPPPLFSGTQKKSQKKISPVCLVTKKKISPKKKSSAELKKKKRARARKETAKPKKIPNRGGNEEKGSGKDQKRSVCGKTQAKKNWGETAKGS